MTLKQKYESYKRRAKIKGIEFRMSLWKFDYYTSKDCYICKKSEAGGLDRVKNTEGYTDRNVAPCCFDCNRMKSNKTPEQFKEYLSRLNPEHELLTSFNKLTNYDAYNKKMRSIERLIHRMVRGEHI